LTEQITTLQQYFDACSTSGGVQSLETEHGLRAVDFKGEAITFRETTSAVLVSLNHCLDIVMQKEDGTKRKLDKEIEKRKKLEDELK
jgi:collagen type IV alpha-3-binding protein